MTDPETAGILKRFWSKVARGNPDDCWLWTAAKNRGGYGNFWLDGTMQSAHRVIWDLLNGPIPEGDGYHGICVLHRCDTPLCVNPGHLFLGTHGANMTDKMEKDRHPSMKGENNGFAKLTEEDVRDIRSRYVPWVVSQQQLADEYGVARTTITWIVNGGSWTHVGIVDDLV